MFKFSDGEPYEVRKQDDDCKSQWYFDVYTYEDSFAKTRKCKPGTVSHHLLYKRGRINLTKRSVTVR